MSEQKRQTRDYTIEFRAEAARQVIEQNRSAHEVANSIGIPYQTLAAWVIKFRKGIWRLDTIGAGTPVVPMTKAGKPLSLEQQKIRELEKQVRRLTMEREILKKAMAYCVDVPK